MILIQISCRIQIATIAGEPLAYAYDGIGNFTSVTGGAVTNTYSANELNQYEEVASGDTTIEPTHTPNGELASFGDWTYAYDALSRLTEVRSNGVIVAFNSYDYQGRRVRLVTQTAAHTFIYDGWNVVLELVEHAGVTDRIEYYWGKDLSGTLQGAGGVGGLLYLKRNGAIYVPFYDACGNVMEYRAADGSLAAAYVYDAFGRTVSQSGPLADTFRFRYSTKSFDCETGLYYYGYRYYLPELRRWITRDVIEENGGVNLYCYCANSSIQNFDYLGHETFQTITMKRKHVIWKDVFRDAFGLTPRNNGYYGHWWIEIGSEAYGWWPRTDPSLSETIFGTPGVLNGGQKNDPHAGDKADESFHPRRASGGQLEYGPAKKGKCKCVTEEDVANCIRAFAAQYSGKWSYPIGQNCHSFQTEAMSACCMTR